ncbi:MAG: tetratricopeptide repeat protein [Chitinophagaceae bacterium]|nr:MAG: tetratricopeptide repeat protein [Chitinophagaceae bacterium]
MSRLTGPLLPLFFLLPLLAQAQNREIDSLHRLALKASGRSQADLFLKSAAASRNINADTSLYFAGRAIEIARALKYSTGEMQANILLGRAMATKGSYELAKKYYGLAETAARREHNDSFMVRAMMGTASCFWHTGKHAEGIELNLKAIRISEKNGMPVDIANAKAGMGMIYQTQGKTSLAEHFLREALELFRIHAAPPQALNAMHTLANVYGMQGKIAEAMALDKEGLALAGQTGNLFLQSMFYDNMANCYLYGKPPDYQLSLRYFRMSYAIDSSFGNNKQMSDGYRNMGTVFMEQGRIAEAIPYITHSVLLARKAGFLQGEQEGNDLLAKLYKDIGQDTLAYRTLRESILLKDSLVSSNREARIAELQAFYETEKQQQTIQLQEIQLSRKNYILWGTLITALLAGLLGYSLYRRYKLKQKSRLQQEIMTQQELAASAVIEAEEKERQRIARDLHDGVGQMMSAAKMNLSAFEAGQPFRNEEDRLSFDKIVGLVDESCREIREVSHNMVPNALLKHSLAAAVRDFLDKISQKAISIHLYTEGLDQRLDSNVETVLYRVIQECVNNVIRHSRATSLDISIIRDADGISATIEDNGQGFDSSSREGFEGIGLKNIQARIEYLKGTIDIDSSPGKGTMIGLHVPLENRG